MADQRHHTDNDGAARDDGRDLALLGRIAEQRDRNALAELYRIYFHSLQRFIYQITNDLELAQEGVNDVMLVVWTRASTFSGRSKVSTWIMGIAYHKALKLAQRSRRWTSRFKGADYDAAIERIPETAGLTDALMLKDLFTHALKSLSPKHRAVVELTYFHGCSYEEIALIMDCPVNTVKTRMFHARAKLKEVVRDIGQEAPEA
jgi:RNA polymerase sigma factor (sigma-70 family)